MKNCLQNWIALSTYHVLSAALKANQAMRLKNIPMHWALAITVILGKIQVL